MEGLVDSGQAQREQFDNTFDDVRQFVQRSQAWYARERPVGREDYLKAQAYLEGVIELATGGRWYKLRYIAQKIDAVFDHDLGLPEAWQEPSEEVASRYGCQQQPMLVYEIQCVEADKRVVPSWIGLQFLAQGHCDGAGLPRLVLQPLVDEVLLTGRERKGGVIGRSAMCDRGGGNQMIEGRAQVMDSVTQRGGGLDWKRLFEGDLEPGFARLSIHYLPTAVRLTAQVGEDCVIKLRDMRLRALYLHAGT